MTHTALPPGKVMYVMGLVCLIYAAQRLAHKLRCTRHDLLIKYVDVHAMKHFIADYSPKTWAILMKDSAQINTNNTIVSF